MGVGALWDLIFSFKRRDPPIMRHRKSHENAADWAAGSKRWSLEECFSTGGSRLGGQLSDKKDL